MSLLKESVRHQLSVGEMEKLGVSGNYSVDTVTSLCRLTANTTCTNCFVLETSMTSPREPNKRFIHLSMS